MSSSPAASYRLRVAFVHSPKGNRSPIPQINCDENRALPAFPQGIHAILSQHPHRLPVATFYHSFNRLRLLEQTTVRLNFSRGHILIEGWIPTQLSLAGLVDEDGLATLRTLFKANLQVEQRFHNAGTFSVHGGMSEQIVAEVSATTSAPDRQKEYQRAIQAGMRKLVAAIRSEYPIEIGIDEGISSLAIALAASEGDSRNRFIPPQ